MFQFLKSYVVKRTASVAIAFALIAPVIIGASGVSIDYARAYMVKQRLGQAVDAAALAGASSATAQGDIEAKIRDFFRANYPEEKIGVVFDPQVTIDGNEISVYVNAYYNTTFVRLFGFDKINIDAKTIVQRDVQGIEVVLVMDNTGSMSRNNNIAALRTAATNFVNIMFDSTSNDDYVRIGLVPYSTSVNVGPYGLGEDTGGNAYGDAFVNNPYDFDYNKNNSNEWHGCVLASDSPDDTVDQEGPWDMYRYCRDDNEELVCDFNWQYQCTGPWWNRTCGYEKIARRTPNYICPKTSILPMTSDRDDLLDQIGTMQASGHTYGNYGMVWGYRVISPEYPFEEAAAWNNPYWRKAIVMMTDGVNTMHPRYSTYGPTNDHNIDANDLNDKFAEVCDNLKEDNVIIYTITFTSGVSDNTKDFYRNCATSIDQYHDAPSQDKLIEVFETISRELSNLYIKG